MARGVVFALALAACAHTPDLPLRPDPRPPAGSTVETFTAKDGTQLLMRHWAAGGGAPQGAPPRVTDPTGPASGPAV